MRRRVQRGHPQASQRQFRLVRALLAGAAGRPAACDGSSSAPAAVRAPAVDHDLHGAARAVGAGEEDALLDVDGLPVGLERPQVAVGQHQDGAVRPSLGGSPSPPGAGGSGWRRSSRGCRPARRWRRSGSVLAVEARGPSGAAISGAVVDRRRNRRHSRRARGAGWRRRPRPRAPPPRSCGPLTMGVPNSSRRKVRARRSGTTRHR